LLRGIHGGAKQIIPETKEAAEVFVVMTRIGGMVSGSRAAYTYLPNSVTKFPDQARLAEMMRDAGFDHVEYWNLTGGIAALHFGRKV